MIGPRPIETVGNCQKSGISHGCGYDERPLSVDLLAKVFELFLGDAPFEKGARVHAGRRVSLKEDEVAAERLARRAEEVIEADVVERRRRREAGDVTAELRADLVRAHDRRERVPADVVAQPRFDLAVAGHLRLLVDRDRVDVRRLRARAKRARRCAAPRRRAVRSVRVRGSGPSAARTPRIASSHSRVSCGSGSVANVVVIRTHLF